MACLPEDIIMVILSKLSVQSISRFRCVCKLWYEFLKNPNFIKMHLQHAVQNNRFSVLIESYKDPSYSDKGVYYAIDFDVTSSSYHMAVQTDLPHDTFVPNDLLIDSCDGLIGLSTGNPNGDTLGMICLWNPSTREYKNISLPTSIDNKSFKSLSTYGVVYDWKIDDYKLFLMVAKENDNVCSEVWVSRLGSDIWKSIGIIPYDIRGTNVFLKPSKGVIYWIDNAKGIVSFDIVEERIKEFQIPGCYLNKSERGCYEYMEVGVLGEDLCLSVNPTSRKGNIEIWVMKEYGVVDSWTKIFSILKDEAEFDSLWPLHYLNKDQEILLYGYIRHEGEGTGKEALLSYDPKNESLVTLDIAGMPEHFFVTPFVGSLVSLNSGEFVKTTNRSELDTRCCATPSSYNS